MTQQIFISGSMAYDDIMVFPHHFKDYFHPEKLHQINVSFAVTELAKHLGGIATNISYSLRLTSDYMKDSGLWTLDSKKIKQKSRVEGLESRVNVFPVGAVGRDGDLLLDFFKNNNIDTSHVLKDEKLYTATGKVITDMNDNQIWGFYYGACAIDTRPWTLDSKQENKKGNYRLDPDFHRDDTDSAIKTTNHALRTTNSPDFWIVSATHEKPFTSVLKHVIKNKLPYMFDPGMALTWIRDDLLKKGVFNATYVVGNDYETSMIEKRLKMSVAEMVKSGVNVITTLGEKGVKFDGIDVISTPFDELRINSVEKSQKLRSLDSNNTSSSARDDKYNDNNKVKEIKIKAVRVRKVVDPTGAGDAWRGGFVGALVAGKPIRECLVMGNVMASFAVQAMGTVEYKTNALEITKRIKTLNPKQ